MRAKLSPCFQARLAWIKFFKIVALKFQEVMDEMDDEEEEEGEEEEEEEEKTPEKSKNGAEKRPAAPPVSSPSGFL